MKILNQWLLAATLSLTLPAAIAAETLAEADLEFLEFLALDMPSPQQQARDKLANFGKKLAIRPEQQAAWDAFSEHAIANQAANAARHQERLQQRAERKAPMTALEMVDAHIANLNQQLAEARENHKVLSALDAVLDDSQRTQFDHAMRMLVMKKMQQPRR
jgi:hypothetical protein